MRVAAGREDEHRAPPRRAQLRVVDGYVGEDEPDENRRELLRRQPRLLELR